MKDEELAQQIDEAKKNRQLAKKEESKLPKDLTLNWKESPIDTLASLIVRTPTSIDRDGVPQYLQPHQAAIFAMRCFELGLSPFSDCAWFNTKTNKVAITVEGQEELARLRGYKLGPPKYTRLERPFPLAANKKIITSIRSLGYDKDIGMKCEIPIDGFSDRAEYTAWLSEWYMDNNKNWQTRTDHMLRRRSKGHGLEEITGVGGSADLDKNEEHQPEEFAVSRVEVTEPEIIHAKQEEKQ